MSSPVSEPELSSSEESADTGSDISDDDIIVESDEEEKRRKPVTATKKTRVKRSEYDSDGGKERLDTASIDFDFDTVLTALKSRKLPDGITEASIAKAVTHLPLLASNVVLHEHQKLALKWLAHAWHMECGCILGDQMGLGKTLEAISLIAYACGIQHCPGPYLVVCPLSVLPNWASEFKKFAPDINVLVYHGNKGEREAIQRDITATVMKQPKEQRKDPRFDFNVLATTYETMLMDVGFLGRFRWRLAVIDEAHRLKNYNSKAFIALSTKYAITRCLLMTGTPVQNKLTELYPLLSLASPKVFPIGMADAFVSAFATAVARDNTKPPSSTSPQLTMEQLQSLLTHVMLRRTLADVGLTLPPLTETIIQCPMTEMQRQWYLTVLEGHLPQLVASKAGGSGGFATTGLQNIVTQLRKVCDHPYLFPGAEPEPFKEGEHIWQNSGKAWVLDRLLLKLRAEGRKVLVFSQFTRMLDILQDYLSYRGWPYERLDGSVRSEERWAAIRSFQRSPSVLSASSKAGDVSSGDDDGTPFVFLLSTRAGGVGVNLTNADTVIMYDSDWNPHADLQAIGRAHRIGQTKPVQVLRFMTTNSVEEVVLRRALTKLGLTNRVVAGGVLTGLSQQSISGDTSSGDDDTGTASTVALDTSSLLRMIQFGLAKLVSSDSVCALSNAMIDAAIVQATNQSVAAAVTASSGGSGSGAGGVDVSLSIVDIETAASGLQSELYKYQGKEYNPTKASASQGGEFGVEERKSSDDGESTVEDDEALKVLIAKREAVLETKRRTLAPVTSRPPPQRKPPSTKPRKPKVKRRDEDRSSSDSGSSLDSFIVSDSEVDEEEAEKRRQSRKRKHKAVTRDVNYVSSCLPLPTTTPDHGVTGYESVTEDEGEEAQNKAATQLEYVIGDATQVTANLTRESNSGKPDTIAVILHCVDASGKWGGGGMFTAIDNLDESVGRAYAAAGRNGDLSLGNAHLISIPPSPYRTVSVASEYVCLLVVLKRDGTGALTLDTEAFKQSLVRLSTWVLSKGDADVPFISVHTPRIGARMPGVSWYAVERLLTRCLSQRHIRTIVYYYNRNAPKASTPTTVVTKPTTPTPRKPSSPKPKPADDNEQAIGEWIEKAKAHPDVVKLCPGYEDNIRFIYSQSTADVKEAMENMDKEMDTMSVADPNLPVLTFFQAVMKAAMHHKHTAAE